MLVQVKQLLYWKTEHGNASNCQDAPSYDPAQGLFAVADGASTSLFPALWARILAQHFVTTPLMSDDPFEVEWWVRIAQNEYKQRVPTIHKSVAWNVKEKMRNQCSDSTLATLRITKADNATAQAMLLVFGDSCILRGDTGKETVSSFILQTPSEFNRAPLCIPSDLKHFNRDFHRCQTKAITLNTSDQVIIATDAVARWILGRGEMPDIWNAFQQVYQCSIDDWYMFVEGKRQCKEMVDDDSTALVLTFCEHSALQYPTADRGNEENQISLPTFSHRGKPDGFALGCVNRHSAEVITQRKAAFEEAAKSDDKRLLAIAYGDGNDLSSVTTTPPLDTIDIAHAREVANALKEVLGTFSAAQNSPSLVQKVKPVWDKYSHLLQDEPCAANLRETLRNNGIIPPTPALAPIHPPKPITTPSLEDTIDLKDQQNSTDTLQPNTAQASFNDLLQQGTNPAKLLRAYDAARRADPSLTLLQPIQALLRLAQEFVTAWNTNDPYILAKAYRNINISRFSTQIVFTSEEVEKCVLAYNLVQRQKEEMRHTIVARVDDYFILLENYIGTYIIKHMYIRYLLSQPPASQPETIEHVHTTHSLNQNEFPLLVLEELMDSILINSGIKAIPLSDSLHQELEQRMTQVADQLKQFEESQPDVQFRRHELGRKDLNLFARMITVPQLFATYLNNQRRLSPWPKKLTFEDWLREKKEEEKDKIFFGETECYALTDRTKILSWLRHYVKMYIYPSGL
jgi:hypothetical protein